ncbi:MAG: fumarylacetoacetate hydrolase family protein [Alphaproteobacteria bacterium]
MKLVSFVFNGRETWGVAMKGGLVDVGVHFPDRMPTLNEALTQADAWDRARDWSSAARKPDAADGTFTYLPPVTRPGKIVCVGLNYRKHAAETNNPIPAKPLLFPRWPDSHVAHLQPILRPKESERFDFEGELAVIIGKAARRVPLDKALDYVAGYSIYNDGSIRDWQRHTTQYMPGKNYWRSGSFGPCMVTTDEIPDPSKLRLTTRLNDTVVQDEGIDDLIFNVPQLIEYISTFMPLHPGDVIVTGTPSGVGAARTPPLWMKHGDTLEIEISKIGTLKNPVVNE